MSRQKERSFEHWKREEIDQSIRRKEKRRKKLEVLQQELLGAEVLADVVREDRARSSGNDEPISPHHKHFSELERQQRTASLSLRAARKSFKMRKTGTRLESAVGIKAVFSPARTPKTAKAHDEGSGHPAASVFQPELSSNDKERTRRKTTGSYRDLTQSLRFNMEAAKHKSFKEIRHEVAELRSVHAIAKNLPPDQLRAALQAREEAALAAELKAAGMGLELKKSTLLKRRRSTISTLSEIKNASTKSLVILEPVLHPVHDTKGQRLDVSGSLQNAAEDEGGVEGEVEKAERAEEDANPLGSSKVQEQGDQEEGQRKERVPQTSFGRRGQARSTLINTFKSDVVFRRRGGGEGTKLAIRDFHSHAAANKTVYVRLALPRLSFDPGPRKKNMTMADAFRAGIQAGLTVAKSVWSPTPRNILGPKRWRVIEEIILQGAVEERVVDSLFFQCISMSGETINNEEEPFMVNITQLANDYNLKPVKLFISLFETMVPLFITSTKSKGTGDQRLVTKYLPFEQFAKVVLIAMLLDPLWLFHFIIFDVIEVSYTDKMQKAHDKLFGVLHGENYDRHLKAILCLLKPNFDGQKGFFSFLSFIHLFPILVTPIVRLRSQLWKQFGGLGYWKRKPLEPPFSLASVNDVELQEYLAMRPPFVFVRSIKESWKITAQNMMQYALGKKAPAPPKRSTVVREQEARVQKCLGCGTAEGVRESSFCAPCHTSVVRKVAGLVGYKAAYFLENRCLNSDSSKMYRQSLPDYNKYIVLPELFHQSKFYFNAALGISSWIKPATGRVAKDLAHPRPYIEAYGRAREQKMRELRAKAEEEEAAIMAKSLK